MLLFFSIIASVNFKTDKVMEQKTTSQDENPLVRKSLEVTIKIGLVIGLIFWCFYIVKPFLMITLWGIIIAVSMAPMYKWVRRKLGNRKTISAALVTIIMLIVILIPFVLLGGSLIEAITWIKDTMTSNQSLIPPPNETIKTWPLIGKPLFDIWQHASTNMVDLAGEYKTQLMTALSWFLSTMSAAGLGVLMFIVSILISGVLLFFSDKGGDFADRIGSRLLGEHGLQMINDAEVTIRNVSRGILGVSFIQAVMLGVGFLLAGIPGAGLWAMLAFFLAIIQIGVGPIVAIGLIYAFLKLSMFIAIPLAVWCGVIFMIDNVLKPIMLGKGAPVPMVVIFLGAIGGFISFGIIGLFVGAVVLSLGYNLFIIWLD